MKKLFSFVALLGVLFCGTAFAAYDLPDYASYQVEGSNATIATAVRVVRLVRNPISGANGISFSSGDVLIYDTVSDDGVTVNYPTNCGISTSSDAVAGVAVGSIPTSAAVGNSAAEDIGKINWGYIIIYGPAQVNHDGTTVSAGEGLRASATSGKSTSSCTVSDAGTVAVGTDALGFALDASSSTEVIDAFVRTR